MANTLPESVDPPDDSEQKSLVLTAEERKAFLGKLTEFELALEALPPMQANFVLAYLADPTHDAKAGRAAGYSEKGLYATVNKLKNKPAVANAIALGEQLREDRTHLTSSRTLHELAILAFSDITNYKVNPSTGDLSTREGIPGYATRAVQSIDWDVEVWTDDKGQVHSRTRTKVKLWNKNDALKMIAVYQRLLNPEAASTVIDNSKHLHLHEHQHNTWQFGDQKITF